MAAGEELLGIEGNPYFAHLIDYGERPVFSPDDLAEAQRALLAQDYNTAANSDDPARVSVLFGAQEVLVYGRAGRSSFPYNEVPYTGIDASHRAQPAREGTPLWLGRALFTHLVLSSPPDTVFGYADLVTAMAPGRPDAVLGYPQRQMRAWWERRFVHGGRRLVLGNNVNRTVILANPSVPVSVGTTHEWDVKYRAAHTALSQRVIPQ
ncbi:MAG TPA: hypothetical protein VLF71_01620 [Candidatus Saccharimonadales bacterium]|nr:hypothetical protein [Candidatus Saccharimonadales bacterium]